VDEPRRNDAFDRELRRAFAAGGGDLSGSHVDAEVAAAWIEHRLDEPSRLEVEAHLADCFDCQAMLATLARISPEEVTARGAGLAWWRRLRAGWLVPATLAAAAALVIWVAVPEQRRATESAQSFAPPPSAPSVSTTPDAAAPQSEPAEAERKELRQQPAAPSSPATVAPPLSAPLERRDRLADAAAPAAPLPAPAPPPPPAAESDKASAKLEAVPTPVEAQRGNRFTVTGETPVAPASPRQEAAAGASARAVDSLGARAALRQSSAPLVVAADSAARWQRSGTAIEFAPRADVPFTTATLPVAADAIAAGSAPGGTVCWFVGRGGLVLVSTDGVRFVRVSAPAAVDLVAITATDARSATVTAAGGRRFRTADQGASWTPFP
jgi:hypothetical protein